VDDSKKEVLTNFIAEVYADPEFQEFMKGMGMEAWEATESEIVASGRSSDRGDDRVYSSGAVTLCGAPYRRDMGHPF